MTSTFLEATYRVYDGDTAIPMRIGTASAPLAELLRRHGASHGGLVTSYNPFGQDQPAATNEAANAKLAADIDQLRLARLRSDGGDDQWNEPGFLVIGGEGEPVAALARKYRQAAWVRIDADGVPQLAACRYPLAGEGPEPCWPPGTFDD